MDDTAPRWSRLSPDERHRAYDNMAAVRDSAALRAGRMARSQRFRAGRRAHLDEPYGAAARQKWDLYPGRPGAPCLVFVHGGYWQANDRADFAFVAEGLAERGWSAALPGYTLAPQARLGAIVDEIGAALDWFAEHRRAFAIEGPVLLSGWSAGAMLAVHHAEHDGIDAVLAISGIYDLDPLRDTRFNDALGLSAIEAAQHSLIQPAAPSLPGLIAVGGDELPALMSNSEALARRRARWPLRVVPGANHFTVLDDLARGQGSLAEWALEALR